MWVAALVAASPHGAADEADSIDDRPAARHRLDNVIAKLVNGDPFDANLRQTVWAADREIIGVGTLVSAGGGSGRYRMRMQMHDGDGKHSVTQISDGRLAWTRRQIGPTLSLARVDLSKLDERFRLNGRAQLNGRSQLNGRFGPSNVVGFLPSRRVGGPVEMLDRIRRDYDLQTAPATLRDRSVTVVTGLLNRSARLRIQQDTGVESLASLHPTQIRVAIADDNDPATGYGRGMPVRWEYWSDPAESDVHPNDETKPKRRQMIFLWQWNSIRKIPPPDEAEFRYEHRNREVDFVDQTARYLDD